MPDPQDIDFLLHDWPFQPGVISARLIDAGDGREVMQMRIEMGVLQMETTGRPDGELRLRFGGAAGHDHLHGQHDRGNRL